MIQETPQADLFKQQMRESLRLEILNSRAVTIAKHNNVYICGDRDEMVYFIESGQVKLLMLSPEGRECLLAIHAAGDIFGELCLSGFGPRLETATAMEESVIKQIPCPKFFARLGSDTLFAGFVRQPGDGRQRTATGQDAVATGAQTRQERPAEHTHRTEDFA
jgi:CRP-like cAMP-binding protein